MSDGMSNETPWLSPGDTVWIIGDWDNAAVPVRVKRAYKGGRADVVPVGQRAGDTSIFRIFETMDWWRDEASARAVLRSRQRSGLTRARDLAVLEVARLAKEREDIMRQMDESEAQVRADLARVEAELAALDKEDRT